MLTPTSPKASTGRGKKIPVAKSKVTKSTAKAAAKIAPIPSSSPAMAGRSKTKALALKITPTSLAATTGRGKPKALTVSPRGTKALAAKPRAATIVDQYRTHKEDTGSTTVQIAQLTAQITDLQKHLRRHAGDHDSRRGLLIMVGKRRRLLNYLNRSNPGQYGQLIADLKLRK